MKTQILDPFKVTADPSRRRMLKMLSGKSMTINNLGSNFPISRRAVSQHLKILYNAGFISIEGIGTKRYCTLKQDGFNNLLDFINYFDKVWIAKIEDSKITLHKVDLK